MATKKVNVYTRDEVAKHNTPNDCWLIINYNIYDVTKFAALHPAGKKIIYEYAGKDATEDFYGLHKFSVLSKYGPRLLVGRLANSPEPSDDVAKGGPEVETATAGRISTIPFAEPAFWRESWHSPYYNDSHKTFRKNLRTYLTNEIKQHAIMMESLDKHPPKEILKELAKVNFWHARFGPGEHMHGKTIFGVPGEQFDYFHELITHEEVARVGCPGYMDGLGTGLVIGLPPVSKFGTGAVKERIVSECLAGEKVICLAISEPFAGSDVANIRATATKTADGKHYIVNGIKKWITNGLFADYFVCAVRTGGKGMGGISLLVVERTEGVRTEKIKVSYGGGAGTALVIMEDVKVPVENLLGGENGGFQCIMANFNHERWYICCLVAGGLRGIYEESFLWAMQRRAFGKRLISQPVVRQKLAAIACKSESFYCWLEQITWQMTKMSYMEQFTKLAAAISLLKVLCSRTLYEVSDNAVQLFGGRSITTSGMGINIEKMQRQVKFAAILGGSEEVMADLGIRLAQRSFPADARL